MELNGIESTGKQATHLLNIINETNSPKVLQYQIDASNTPMDNENIVPKAEV